MGALDKLTAETPLRRYGYQIVRHGRQDDFADLRRRFDALLQERLERFSGGKRLAQPFKSEEYHNAMTELGVDHHAFMKEYRRELPEEFLQHPYLRRLVETASEVTQQAMRVYDQRIEFRVCRPNADDNNPWHRDHWFPYFTPLVNVYLPMSSSYVDSALQVVPFSHEWTDEDVVPTFFHDPNRTQKTNKSGVAYSVPEIKSCRFPIVGHRPDVLPSDFMLFSPKCVHGAGSNFSLKTRFSFEFRLEVAP